MVKHTLKILQHLLQDFQSVSEHFETSCIKEIFQKCKYVSTYWWYVVSECHNALGMEDESIPDESITATSYLEDYFPWYARVNRTSSNYKSTAWCTNITSGNQSLTVSIKHWALFCFKPYSNSKSRSVY